MMIWPETPERNALISVINERLVKHYGRDKVNYLNDFDCISSIGLDSLDAIEMSLELEERLKLQFDLSAVKVVTTFGELVSLLESKTKGT